MNGETLIPAATSLGGGSFAGIMLGYFVKKIIKVLMFVVGGIADLLVYLQQQEIISINIEKVQSSSSTFGIISFISSFDTIAHINDTNLGIPLAGGLSAGFAVGILEG